MAPGLVLIDKPSAITSHDAVQALRRATGEGRAGHLGTLDPFATGLLPVLVGCATRLLVYHAHLSKVYRAVMQLGVATDTLDPTGNVVEEVDASHVDEGVLRAALLSLQGPQEQRPPMHSARKVGGRRLYQLARRGAEVERLARNITVHRLDLLAYDASTRRATIEAEVSTGTYVRVLADDAARACGTRAHLLELRRLAVGPYRVERAVPVGAHLREGWRAALHPMRELLPELPALALDIEGESLVRHGRAVAAPSGLAPPGAAVRLVGRDGELHAVGVVEGDPVRVQPRVVLQGM